MNDNLRNKFRWLLPCFNTYALVTLFLIQYEKTLNSGNAETGFYRVKTKLRTAVLTTEKINSNLHFIRFELEDDTADLPKFNFCSSDCRTLMTTMTANLLSYNDWNEYVKMIGGLQLYAQ